jgi:predicted MFS family arabinose efflux permease
MNWRNAVVQAGILVLGLAVIFAITKLSTIKSKSEPYLERMRILSRDKMVVVFFITTILVVGIEGGTIGMLTTYLMDLREFTQVTSKIGLVVFLSGIAIGRIIIGIFAPQDKINQVLLTMFGFSVIIFGALFLFDFKIFTYVVVFLAGLSISALLPLMLAEAGLIYNEMAGTVLGTIKVAIPIGGIFLPFMLSLLVQYMSFEMSLLIFPLSLLIAFILIFMATSAKSKSESSSKV